LYFSVFAVRFDTSEVPRCTEFEYYICTTFAKCVGSTGREGECLCRNTLRKNIAGFPQAVVGAAADPAIRPHRRGQADRRKWPHI